MRHHRSRQVAISSLVSIAALAAACSTTGGGGTGGAPNTDAMAATYRHLFANNASALQGRAANYCVGIGAGPALSDPPEAVMTALAGVTPEVQPASSCRAGEQVVNASGQPSLIFALVQVRCDGSTDCLFEGGYHEANLSASRGRYRARLVNGQWQVAPEGPQAVS
jgi:hypothetical protein